MTAAVSHNERGMLLRGAVRMLGIAPLLLTKKCQAPEFSYTVVAEAESNKYVFTAAGAAQ